MAHSLEETEVKLRIPASLTYIPPLKIGNFRCVASIEKGVAGAKARRIEGGGRGATRVAVRLGTAEIKIETSPVTRGVIHPPKLMTVSDAVQDAFGFAETQVVSFEDLYGDKLHAALDRQHPRDLFDVKLLYENEGLTDALFWIFLIYVASSPRPAHELLNPNLADLEQSFAQEFVGMTKYPVSLDALIDVRARLIGDIHSRLNDTAQVFLLSLQDATPDFDAIDLPAVQSSEADRRKSCETRRTEGAASCPLDVIATQHQLLVFSTPQTLYSANQ